jgi:hypothetical protein
MSSNEVDELKSMVRQFQLEQKEDMKGLRLEMARMRKSLISCQSHCHVSNEDKKELKP